MKVRKIMLTIMMVVSGVSLFGQINPVNNLIYQQIYQCGNYNCPSFNCFEISWDSPESSSDTLQGYNVYRDSNFWVFTQDTVIDCSGYFPCEYNDFYDSIPFWVTVKAVYNNDSVVSIANDSVYVKDLCVSVSETARDSISLFRNPVLKGDNITLLLKGYKGELCSVQVSSLKGEIIKEYRTEVMYGKVIFSSAGMPPGLYIINVRLKGKTVRKKLLVE